jgi:phage shock protein PspC (stress-responsive transcriptional regulator)
MDNETERAAPRRLTRRSHDRVLAGVAGGLADYTGMDPIIFRIAFIALAIAGGSGFLIYLLAWLVIPEENEEVPVGRHLLDRLKNPRWFAFALIAIAIVVALDGIGLGHSESHFVWAIGLVAIGVVLLRYEAPGRSGPSQPARATALEAPGTAVSSTVARTASVRERRPRSPLGLLTIGAAMLVVAGAVLLSTAAATTFDLGQYFGLAIGVLGLGLIVGGWWGRGRLLILLGILLVPLMLAGSVIHMPLRGTLGTRYYQLRSNVADEYNLLAGGLTFDLTRYPFGDEPVELNVNFVAGAVDIYVPPGVDVTVNGSVDAGVVDVFGEGLEGRDLAFSGSDHRDGLTKGELVINVEGGFGSFDTTWATWFDRDMRIRRMEAAQHAEKRAKQRQQQQKVEPKAVNGQEVKDGRPARRDRKR